MRHTLFLGRGSSPLTRGKPLPSVRPWWWPGLIPAHAGKTGRETSGGTRRRAHPRSRGENQPPSLYAAQHPGSSPLTRGKLFAVQAWAPTEGLIPAHAGKTSCSITSARTCRAHPRSRGENFFKKMASWPLTGSSPLTRGKHGARGEDSAEARLIPAHAGKTGVVYKDGDAVGAHPRSRGENCNTRTCKRGAQGSSPLTRGKRGHERCHRS